MTTRSVRILRSSLTSILSLALTCLLFTGAPPASADTGNGTVSGTWMNLGTWANRSQQDQYTALINSLRDAAGHHYRGPVLENQRADQGIIRMTLSIPETGGVTTLWFTPQDLYLRGYTDLQGRTHVFDDTPSPVIARISAAQGGREPERLSFGSNYNSLSRAARVGRENLEISFGTVRGAVNSLAGNIDPNARPHYAASALMLLIQFTSEAARFNHVFDMMSNIMGNPGHRYSGVPTLQQRLENNWRAISRWAYSISQNPAEPNLTIAGVGTLHTWRDAVRYLAMMLGNFNLPQESGNPSRTEL